MNLISFYLILLGIETKSLNMLNTESYQPFKIKLFWKTTGIIHVYIIFHYFIAVIAEIHEGEEI